MLARVVAVLAALVSVVLLQGIQCGDGMAMMMPAGTTQVSMPGPPDGDAPLTAHEADESSGGHSDGAAPMGVATFAVSGHLTDGFGGVLAICLTLLVAVLLAVAGLRRRGSLIGAVALIRWTASGVGRLSVPMLGLTRLCVLRT